MKETLEQRECDECGKVVTSKKVIYVGGHPFNDWFELNKRNNEPYDFCSIKCLKKYKFPWEEDEEKD